MHFLNIGTTKILLYVNQILSFSCSHPCSDFQQNQNQVQSLCTAPKTLRDLSPGYLSNHIPSLLSHTHARARALWPCSSDSSKYLTRGLCTCCSFCCFPTLSPHSVPPRCHLFRGPPWPLHRKQHQLLPVPLACFIFLHSIYHYFLTFYYIFVYLLMVSFSRISFLRARLCSVQHCIPSV